MESQLLFVAVALLLTFSGVMTGNSPNGPNCPELYQRYSTSHSYCQSKNPSCNILYSGISSEDEIDLIVDTHNNYRSIIATKKKESKGLPAAADMLYMEWDEELASIAQHHADRCIFEHDKNEERRVKNFGVGQNIAKMTLSGKNVQAPKADWEGAIGSFFKEIQYFTKRMVCGTRDEAPGTIGNFTQVIWAQTFRVGCGYTLYKEGNTFIRYYVCNYGPAGNYGGSCVYKEGKACSKCPINTECTKGEYTGLCERTSDEPPINHIKVPNIFKCDLRDQYNSPNCYISDMEGYWKLHSTLSGKYFEIVLRPGESGTIFFDHYFSASNVSNTCLQIRFRKGPNLAKDGQMSNGEAIFTVPDGNDWNIKSYFPNYYTGEEQQQFTAHNMGLGLHPKMELKITFAVPKEATSEQFFSFESIYAFNDKCESVEY